MINPERILKRIKDIEEAAEELKEIRKIPLKEFLDNVKLRYISYASFIIITESIIDICYHIAVKKFKSQPKSYGECFQILRDSGLISPELSEKLVTMAKFRNFLIHRYSSVDYSKLYEYINELESIKKFQEIVLELSK